MHDRIWSLTFPVVDALALGCWAAAGAQKTLDVGLSWLPAVLLGTVTAVGGGAMRDLIVRRIPQIFGGNTLYATCAVVASVVTVLFTYSGHALIRNSGRDFGRGGALPSRPLARLAAMAGIGVGIRNRTSRRGSACRGSECG